MKTAAAAVSLLIMNACTSISGPSTGSVKQAGFGNTKAGESTELYTLKNANGVVAKVTTYGATLVELHVPRTSSPAVLPAVKNGAQAISK